MFEKVKQRRAEGLVLSIIDQDHKWRSIVRVRKEYEKILGMENMNMDQRLVFYEVLGRLESGDHVERRVWTDLINEPLERFESPAEEIQQDGRPVSLFYRSRIAAEVFGPAGVKAKPAKGENAKPSRLN